MSQSRPVMQRTSSPLSLKEQAYGDLKRLILSGELPAGTVLSVRQLATQLEMSRTPVHAAIERLEADGLVTLAPQQGVVVCELSIQDIANHYEIRQALEPYVMRRMAGKLSPEQIALLRDNQSRNKAAVREQRIDDLVKIDAEFHQLICHFFGNDEIIDVMQRLSDKVYHVIYRITQKYPQRASESFDEHQAILDALESGEAEKASQLVYDHLEDGLRRFRPVDSL